MVKWVSDGRIKCPETVTDGFENLPRAFVNMMKGGNFGKAGVKFWFGIRKRIKFA